MMFKCSKCGFSTQRYSQLMSTCPICNQQMSLIEIKENIEESQEQNTK